MSDLVVSFIEFVRKIVRCLNKLRAVRLLLGEL